MKETKLVKRIFAGFVAFIVILLISCGDLQIFADSDIISVSMHVNANLLGWNFVQWFTNSVYDVSLKNGAGTINSSYSTVTSSVSYSFDTVYSTYVLLNDGSVNKIRSVPLYNGVRLSTDPDNPTYIVLSTNYCLFEYNTIYQYSSTIQGYFVFVSDSTPTPTPEPTPTPTPVPTPTPEPTFNPDQPTYTTFFNHLLNDGNNALNALYLSWTQANNKFYTGIFFIGLPIMIGIFGIVASIFFGGDD